MYFTSILNTSQNPREEIVWQNNHNVWLQYCNVAQFFVLYNNRTVTVVQNIHTVVTAPVLYKYCNLAQFHLYKTRTVTVVQNNHNVLLLYCISSVTWECLAVVWLGYILQHSWRAYHSQQLSWATSVYTCAILQPPSTHACLLAEYLSLLSTSDRILSVIYLWKIGKLNIELHCLMGQPSHRPQWLFICKPRWTRTTYRCMYIIETPACFSVVIETESDEQSGLTGRWVALVTSTFYTTVLFVIQRLLNYV